MFGNWWMEAYFHFMVYEQTIVEETIESEWKLWVANALFEEDNRLAWLVFTQSTEANEQEKHLLAAGMCA